MPLAPIWSGASCFLYTSAREFQGFKVYDIEKPEPQSSAALQGTIPCKTPPIDDWQEFTEVKKGYFYVERDSIRALRDTFLRNGQCPSTKLAGPTHIRKLIVKADSETGKRTEECHVYALPQYHSLMRSWVHLMREHIDLKWCGEGLGGNLSLPVVAAPSEGGALSAS